MDKDLPFSYPPTIVSRAEWGANEPKYKMKAYKKEEFPITTVYFSMKTGYPECHNKEDCMKIIKEKQEEAMTKGKLPDIPYSFIIGTDGSIYEGRGWETKPDKAIKMEDVDFDPTAFDVGYCGDFSSEDKAFPDNLYDASMSLMELGVRKNFVYEAYDIMCHREEEDKFQPDYWPGEDKFKNIKPFEVKEVQEGEPYKPGKDDPPPVFD